MKQRNNDEAQRAKSKGGYMVRISGPIAQFIHRINAGLTKNVAF
jgi:hypothetical protein